MIQKDQKHSYDFNNTHFWNRACYC